MRGGRGAACYNRRSSISFRLSCFTRLFRSYLISVTREYELMWILGAEADEEAGNASVERITTLVKENGGDVASAEPWGRRTLAYEVSKNLEGSYYLAFLKLDSSFTPELERTLESDQDIIRHMLIRHDKPVPVAADVEESDDRRGGNRRGRRT